jgi:hypothetical protein
MNFKLCFGVVVGLGRFVGGIVFQVYLLECCFIGEFVESVSGKCLLGLWIGCTAGFV